MTETLIERLERHEGIKLEKYQDTLGKWTIGIGHLITAEDGDRFDEGITFSQAMDLLGVDLKKTIDQVNKACPWVGCIEPVRQDVIYELAFQLGVNGLLEFKKMIADIQAQDWNAAANEMLCSAWNRETPDRCAELANLMLNGNNN